MRGLAAVFLSIALLQAPGGARSAEIVVFSAGPLRPAMEKLAARFQAASGVAMRIVFDTAPGLSGRLARGEKPDVLITLEKEIEELHHNGGITDVARGVASIKLGLATRLGVQAASITDLESFKQLLLQADSIIYNSLASGRAFADQIRKAGLENEVRGKVVVVPGANHLDELKKRSGRDVASGQLTQLITDATIRFLGA